MDVRYVRRQIDKSEAPREADAYVLHSRVAAHVVEGDFEAEGVFVVSRSQRKALLIHDCRRANGRKHRLDFIQDLMVLHRYPIPLLSRRGSAVAIIWRRFYEDGFRFALELDDDG